MLRQSNWRRLRRPNWLRIRRVLVVVIYRGLRKGKRRIPPGLRLFVGLLLVLGGLVGFLPILGFWMIPLGIAVASLDIPPLYRVLNAKLRQLRYRRKGKRSRKTTPTEDSDLKEALNDSTGTHTEN